MVCFPSCIRIRFCNDFKFVSSLFKIFVLFFCLQAVLRQLGKEGVSLDDTELQCHQKLQNLYNSTRAAKVQSLIPTQPISSYINLLGRVCLSFFDVENCTFPPKLPLLMCLISEIFHVIRFPTFGNASSFSSRSGKHIPIHPIGIEVPVGKHDLLYLLCIVCVYILQRAKKTHFLGRKYRHSNTSKWYFHGIQLPINCFTAFSKGYCPRRRRFYFSKQKANGDR